MALVGSGAARIANFVIDGSMDANAIDTSLSALVEQIGGTAWVAGDPNVHPGNLDATNIASAPRLSNLHKGEPFVPWTVQLVTPTIPLTQQVIGIVPTQVVGVCFAFTYSQFIFEQESSLTGTIKFFANGVEEGTIEVASMPPGDAYRVNVVGKRYDPGTVLGVDATALKDDDGNGACIDLVFTFWGKTEDVSG
jgi:hypothetical protein